MTASDRRTIRQAARALDEEAGILRDSYWSPADRRIVPAAQRRLHAKYVSLARELLAMVGARRQ